MQSQEQCQLKSIMSELVGHFDRLQMPCSSPEASAAASLRPRNVNVADFSGNQTFDLAKRGTQTLLSYPEVRFQARINLGPYEHLQRRRVFAKKPRQPRRRSSKG